MAKNYKKAIMDGTVLFDYSDSNATASDLRIGKVAYVKGAKVDGSITFRNVYFGNVAEPPTDIGEVGDIFIVTEATE
jgi:hypothetical protein